MSQQDQRHSSNVVWSPSEVRPAERTELLGHPGFTVWLTGLSGSGKSTVASGLERALIDRGVLAYVLDGDNVRHGLCADLGFGADDRAENIRRVGEVARLLTDVGACVLCAFISPYVADRERVRARFGALRFLEVFVDCPLAVCEERDPKGLYRRARAGEIRNFTGISDPYNAPEQADLRLSTHTDSIESSVEQVIGELTRRGWL